MFSAGAARDLIGRRVIVGITRNDGGLIRRDQFHGRIVRATRAEGVVLQSSSGDELTLPPDLRAFLRARRGEYRFKSTGEVVTDPDLQTTWTVTARPPAQP